MSLPIVYISDSHGMGGPPFPRPVGIAPKPACIVGLTNGQLPASVLSEVYSGFGDDGKPAFPKLGRFANLTSARKHRAMQWACWEATGQLIVPVSASDSYRSYEVQERIFRQRYAPGGTYGGCKYWNGVRWCKTGNYATAATPGTSNHGWGMAVDYAVWMPSGVKAIGGSPADRWCRANCLTYGIAYETVPSEDWHLRDYTGDEIPAAVLAFEGPVPEPVGPVTPGGSLVIELLRVQDTWAVFVAVTVNGVAVSVQWCSGARAAAYRGAGVRERVITQAQLKNVALEGPLPTGDVRAWSPADFALHVA